MRSCVPTTFAQQLRRQIFDGAGLAECGVVEQRIYLATRHLQRANGTSGDRLRIRKLQRQGFDIEEIIQPSKIFRLPRRRDHAPAALL